MTATLSRNLTLYSAPLPGSGLLVAFMLRLMDGFIQNADSDLQRSQVLIETFKHAYGRRTDLGDPHFLDDDLLQSVRAFNNAYSGERVVLVAVSFHRIINVEQ